MNATFRIGIVISLIFIAISVYMTIQGLSHFGLTPLLMQWENARTGEGI